MMINPILIYLDAEKIIQAEHLKDWILRCKLMLEGDLARSLRFEG